MASVVPEQKIEIPVIYIDESFKLYEHKDHIEAHDMKVVIINRLDYITRYCDLIHGLIVDEKFDQKCVQLKMNEEIKITLPSNVLQSLTSHDSKNQEHKHRYIPFEFPIINLWRYNLTYPSNDHIIGIYGSFINPAKRSILYRQTYINENYNITIDGTTGECKYIH